MSMVTLNEGVIMGAIREAVAKIVSGIDLEKAKGVCQENIRFAAVDAVEIRDAAICVHAGQHALQMQQPMLRQIGGRHLSKQIVLRGRAAGARDESVAGKFGMAFPFQAKAPEIMEEVFRLSRWRCHAKVNTQV